MKPKIPPSIREPIIILVVFGLLNVVVAELTDGYWGDKFDIISYYTLVVFLVFAIRLPYRYQKTTFDDHVFNVPFAEGFVLMTTLIVLSYYVMDTTYITFQNERHIVWRFVILMLTPLMITLLIKYITNQSKK